MSRILLYHLLLTYDLFLNCNEGLYVLMECLYFNDRATLKQYLLSINVFHQNTGV